ncbi:MAG: thioesterase family protein [Paracoccus sp. (in: a-proteobacteria)]|nr:thioesterase family protein [Paracoccus sp. (in: a-proteobacteria)]
MIYRRQIPVEFGHCDPAGIVFYPRFFEMMNSVVENFCREVLDEPFARMMDEGRGLPAVRATLDFSAPSRLGDVLEWRLSVEEIGGSSIRFGISVEGRLSGAITVVWLGASKRPVKIPAEIRTKLEQYHVSA